MKIALIESNVFVELTLIEGQRITLISNKGLL